MNPKHKLRNALEMLSEVQLMISKNTSLPPPGACLGFDVRI